MKLPTYKANFKGPDRFKESVRVHEEAYQKRLKKRFVKKEFNVLAICTLFPLFMKHFGHKTVPPVSKKTLNMLQGMVKLMLQKGVESEEVYYALYYMVEHWDTLKLKEIVTINGKKWALSEVPNLHDFIICRDSIMSALDDILDNKGHRSNESIFNEDSIF